MSETRYFEEYRAAVLETLGVEDVDIEDLRDFVRWRTKVLEGLGEDPMTESDVRNFEKWRHKVLEALGVTGITTDDTRNFANWRRKVLEGLDVDGFTEEDVRNYEKWRLKVIEGLENMSPSGTVSGDIVTFVAGNNTVIKSLVVNLEPIQEGSGDPSPSNVRPISGYDGVNVYNTGVNIWDEETEIGILNADGSVTTSSNRLTTKNYIPIKEGVEYCFSAPITASSGRGAFYDENHNLVQYLADFPATIRVSGNREYGMFTPPTGAKYLKFCVVSSYGTTYNNDISINYPSTDTSYHPYQGSSYSIAFKDSEDNPITVYGGEIDVVSGEGGSSFRLVDMGTLRWYKARDLMEGILDGAKPFANSEKASAVCSNYKTVTYGAVYDYREDKTIATAINGRVYVYDTDYTDATAFKTAMQGVQLCYELAEPTPIYCEPTEIKTLKGNNTLWSDGDITVVYGKGTREGGD